MERSTAYAWAGTVMLATATILRTVNDGGGEVVGLAVVGIVTLVMSAGDAKGNR